MSGSEKTTITTSCLSNFHALSLLFVMIFLHGPECVPVNPTYLRNCNFLAEQSTYYRRTTVPREARGMSRNASPIITVYCMNSRVEFTSIFILNIYRILLWFCTWKWKHINDADLLRMIKLIPGRLWIEMCLIKRDVIRRFITQSELSKHAP